MEDSDQRTRTQLVNAQELFLKNEWPQCRKTLAEVKNTHLSIQLNSLLCEYKENPARLTVVLKKMMDILVAVNIKLYQQRPQNQPNGRKSSKTPRIAHELYFWNIIVLAQTLPAPEIAQLVASEALHFTDALRTATSLLVLYHLLSTMEAGGRLASCVAFIERQNRLIGRLKKLTPTEQAYRFLNQVLFCRVLLKLGMIDGGRIMYMMKFNQSEQQTKQEPQLTQLAGIPIRIHQQLLHAQIEFHSKNYSQSLKILAELIPVSDTLGKNKQLVRQIIDHNVALVLANKGQTAPAQLLLTRTLNFLTSKDADASTRGMTGRCKENLLLASMAGGRDNEQGLELLKQCHHSYSFKINYRKAQLCFNHYHQLLQNPSRTVTYKDIHDFYDTVYYYPNLPYFQQKAKNKNPNYTNNKFYYRRYVLHPWQHKFQSQNRAFQTHKSDSLQKPASKEISEKKELSKQKRPEKGNSKAKKTGKKEDLSKKQVLKEQKKREENIREQAAPKDAYSTLLGEVLSMCEWFLKEALVVLEKEKSIIVNLQDEEKGLTEQVNEKLYSEYIAYKTSIYSLLCYLYLCRKQFSKTIHYAEQYLVFEKQYQLQTKNSAQQRTHYSVLTYKTQAYCELGRMQSAYATLQDILNSIDYAETATLPVRSTGNQERGQTYFENSSQCNNFGFNLSVLHSRDNKIPQAYNSIQKLLQQMRIIPSNPQANLPLSLIQLLLHYNLRTNNPQSALQILKRRRILNLPGVIGHYQPILTVTK